MMIWLIKGRYEGGEYVGHATSNLASATMEIERLQRCAENPEHHLAGHRFQLSELPVEVEIFDLWRLIREHPAYAFGALFTRADFDRGMPTSFSSIEAEQSLVDVGTDMIENSYEGEPLMHRLTHRLRRTR